MRYIFISLAAVALFASCTSSKVAKTGKNEGTKVEAGVFTESMLYATPWRIEKLEVDGKTLEVPKDVEATIVFDQKDSRVHGRCCNSYFGSFTLKGNVLSFSKMGSTKMLCQGIINDIEMAYHQALSVPQTVAVSGKTLTFKSDKGIITFSAFNLE